MYITNLIMSIESSCVISLICGLPGSGKTYLVNEILRHVCFDIGESPDDKRLIRRLNGINVYVISYDELIPVVGQKQIILTPGVWKDIRKEVIYAAEAFISRVIGLPFSLELSPTAKTFLQRLIQSNKQKINNTKNAFLIDDNFYYQSMRHEWYLLAKKLSMGFCQIYLECPSEIALSRNSTRKAAIPDDVIHLMAKKIEAPNPTKNHWERNSLCINVENARECSVNQVLYTIEESMKQPITSELVEDIDKESARRICSTNVIHQIDIILRHITGEKIKKQASCDKKMIKRYSSLLNDARRDILKSLKQGELTLPQTLVEAIESGNSNNSEIQRTLAAIVQSSICEENFIS